MRNLDGPCVSQVRSIEEPKEGDTSQFSVNEKGFLPLAIFNIRFNSGRLFLDWISF